MSREIHRDLFGGSLRPSNDTNTPQKSPSVGFSPSFEVREEDWRLVIHQLEQLKRKNQDLESKLEALSSRTMDLLRGAKTRIERVGAATQRVEEAVKLKFQEVAGKVSMLTSKVTERKVADAKIEELIERHNLALQNFELRTQQLQKLISEQQMQLMGYKSTLSEAQREISRLKRI
ncbi:MAG: hypothetical protein KDD34_09360 [Bdellovibrionales bacterium]|nr:hypothetical protein [Bdellovibrionales bacterium]